MKKKWKKVAAGLVAGMMLIGVMTPLDASANDHAVAEEVEYLEGGIIAETVIEEMPESVSLQEKPMSRSAAYVTKSGSKTVTYKNSNGTILWSVKVVASFKYNGASSTCTAASATATASHNSWKISSKSSSRSGNTGKATAVGKCYSGGLVIQTVNRTVTLSCSGSGKLS